MKPTNIAPKVLLCALLISAGAFSTAYAAETPGQEPRGRAMDCEMKFNLEGISGFYDTARGEGIIKCNNGQTARLNIRAIGGGIMFGMSEVVDGTGRFSDARTIDELFGSYLQAEVFAGTGKSAAGQVLTKGRISLTLAGTGHAVDFGFTFERFSIERANQASHSRY